MYGVAKLTLLDEYCMERRESLSKLHPIRLIFLTEKKKKKTCILSHAHGDRF